MLWNQQNSSKPTHSVMLLLHAAGPTQFCVDSTMPHKECAYMKTSEVRSSDMWLLRLRCSGTWRRVRKYESFRSIFNVDVISTTLYGVTSRIKIPALYPHLVDMVTRVRAGLSGVRIQVGAKHPDRRPVPPSLLLTTKLKSGQKLRMSGSILLFPLYALIVMTGITAC